MAITFGLTWTITGLWIAFPEPLAGTLGNLTIRNPLFFLAVYAPAIAALVVVLRAGGTSGAVRFLSRLRLWHCPPGWLLFTLLGVPANFYLGLWLKTGEIEVRFPFDNWPSALFAMLLLALLGPVEELGWRGVVLPVLQRKLAPLHAGLVLGIVWATWHVPAFFLSSTLQGDWSLPAFFVGSVAACVIMTPFFNACRGSLLLPAILHFQLINPLFPDAQPHDTVFFVASAILAVVLNRRTMLGRDASVTTVIPNRASRR